MVKGFRPLAASLLFASSEACTNFIVTPGASTDNSTLFSYSADSDGLYGTLGHFPAGKHAPGTKRKIWDWDSGKYLGEIPEAPVTYNVMHRVNEHGLAIGETTFGGLGQLAGTGLIDYGSLIELGLQRSKTAREAIETFAKLVDSYGYASEGESFTIGDPNEVWVLELIGKGKWDKGAVWVAVRIPDGHVSGHANQARITKFDMHDPENCLYSKDVVDFAVKAGLWKPEHRNSFSFAEAYDPITFSGARLSDARVWSFFREVAKDSGFGDRYQDYVLGKNGSVTPSHRMPLSILPKAKLTPLDLTVHHRNHYEGTKLDPTKDVGAGSSGSPFRNRPLVWKYKNKTYVNERTVGVQQTAWSFAVHLRKHLPGPISGVIWFGVDDTTFSIHTPFHGGATRVPHAYADGNGDALTWSNSAFWAFNTVANFVYPRWYLAADLIADAHKKEVSFASELAKDEAEAMELYKHNPAKAIELLTAKSEARAEALVKDEWALFGKLMVKNRDGLQVTSAGPHAPDHGGASGGVVPAVKEIGYTDEWKARIIKDTGDHYLKPNESTHPDLKNDKDRTLNKYPEAEIIV